MLKLSLRCHQRGHNAAVRVVPVRLNRSVIPLALVSIMLGACGDGGDAQRPMPEVRQAAVTEAVFTEDVDTVSTLEAGDLVQLAALASGRIIELKIAQGDRVSAGQLLMTLDQAQEQARLAGLKAKEQKDLLELKRYEFLLPLGAVQASERDQRRAIYIASREEVRAQEATLAYSNLQSPIAGTVADVSVQVGDVVRNGDPFTKLIRNNTLEAKVEVPSTLADRIRVGLPVLLSLPGRNEVMARSSVMSVDPGINSQTQALLVRAQFPNPEGTLRNGQRLRTRVQLESRQEPSVPFAAVTQTSGQSFVFRLGTLQELEAQPGKADLARIKRGMERGVISRETRFALQTPVNLGPLQNKRYPVTKGLKLGQNVIISNLLSLRHGVPVKVQN
ncbi:multidrug efflux pump membrane fusion protein [Synechococcus sp. BIOS-U3-1]|nr:multidrug efflux pump membrane fusion protein [Synechococcus sp. BIOS-U3-1]